MEGGKGLNINPREKQRCKTKLMEKRFASLSGCSADSSGQLAQKEFGQSDKEETRLFSPAMSRAERAELLSSTHNDTNSVKRVRAEAATRGNTAESDWGEEEVGALKIAKQGDDGWRVEQSPYK